MIDICCNGVLMILSAASWRPRRRFSWASLHDVVGFSGWMLGNQVVYYLRKNLDKVLIGAILGAQSLGIYTLAYMLTETLRVQIGSVIGKVMFPAYSRNQSDLAEVRRLYLGVIRYTTLVVFPIATLMILFADPLVTMLFGEVWAEAVAPLQILAVASMVFAFSGDPSALLRGIGKPKIAFNISFWNTIIVAIPALIFGAYYYGLNGASYAVLLHYITSRVISFYFVKLHTGLKTLAISRAALPSAIVFLGLISLHAVAAPWF